MFFYDFYECFGIWVKLHMGFIILEIAEFLKQEAISFCVASATAHDCNSFFLVFLFLLLCSFSLVSVSNHISMYFFFSFF